MAKNKLAYIELPATRTDEMKTFYGALFGWSFQDWGSDYTSFSESGLEGGSPCIAVRLAMQREAKSVSPDLCLRIADSADRYTVAIRS